LAQVEQSQHGGKGRKQKEKNLDTECFGETLHRSLRRSRASSRKVGIAVCQVEIVSRGRTEQLDSRDLVTAADTLELVPVLFHQGIHGGPPWLQWYSGLVSRRFIYNPLAYLLAGEIIISMRTLVRVVAVAVLTPLAAFGQSAGSASAAPAANQPKPAKSHGIVIGSQGVSTGGRAVHNSALVVDTHADTPGRLVDENFDLAQDAGKGHMDFARIKAGNLGAEFFSIWVDPKVYKGREVKRALDMIDSVYEQARLHPDKMMMAFSTQDINRAHQQNKLAALMGVEGGHAIEGDIRVLRNYYRLGVRYMTLTWANTNELGDSSGDLKDESVKHYKGITDFGRQVVRAMNRMGMIVDVSHVADRTMYQALAASRAPVIASHSSSRAITDVPRNMTDDMLVALARNGGVAQVNFYCGFISQKWVDTANRLKAENDPDYMKLQSLFLSERTPETARQMFELQTALQKKLPRPPLSELIDHFDHMIKVAGVDHVGIGSDFDGIDCAPQGIDSAADLPKITAALMQRGYTAADMRKILGGNLMRVFAEVEKTAKQIQAEDLQKDPRKEMAPGGQ
jgi:membrane dipeptidase